MKKFLDIRTTLKRIFGIDDKDAPENKSVKSAEQGIANETNIETETPVALTIWTIERNRYAAPRALCTDIEVYPSEAVVLREDISGYVIDTPSGESVVIEARTGGLVGHSLEVVRDGVSEMTKAQLNTQLDTARKEFNRMNKNVMPNDEFWKALKMGGAEIEIAQDYQE